jgi:tRNA pseudouridine38-40 synthase
VADGEDPTRVDGATMRLAVKVAYDGMRFSGSQIQPGVRTIHSEVARALRQLGEGEPRLLWAGRTDAGVSAAGNVVAFETRMGPDALLPALTFAMEDVWAWAVAHVDEHFEPRHARSRHYRYHLRSDLDASTLQDALAPFVGFHDFTAFCRLEAGVEPRRTVQRIAVARDGPFLLVDVHGENFLWNQVRRMVEAGRRVASDDLAPQTLVDALRAGVPADFGTAPAEPLVLLDVVYPALTFSPPEGGERRLYSRLRRRVEQLELERIVLKTLER